MDKQFMHFWNDIKIRERGRSLKHSVNSLGSDTVAAVMGSGFEDWVGLGDFLLESDNTLTVLECTMQAAAFDDDEAFLKPAVRKLDCWTMVETRLGRTEMESLRAAYLASSNLPALRLRQCHCDPEVIPQLVAHLERLEIGPEIEDRASCDWRLLGEALKQPSSTLCDLSLVDIQSNLDWLADALQIRHCKLRRLALTGIKRIPGELLQMLQNPTLEGLAISTISKTIPGEEFLVKALIASPSLWFFQTTCRNLSPLLLQEGILKAHQISDLVISANYDVKELQAAIRLIPEFLSSPDCKLQSFIITVFRERNYTIMDDLLLQFQGAVLDALENNYRSQLQELHLGPWMSKSLELRCSNLLYRNKLSKDSLGKFVTEFSQPPQVLKLFMCGHPGVGKTTIATNLLRSVTIPAFLQRHSSTQGISLSNLEFGGKNLVIFDLAGQEVYHAFHHYFIRRSENDLFLIVCKLDREKSEDPQQNLTKLQQILTYWLRFIVSHQSPNAQTKPKVFVVLNHFCRPSKLKYNAPEAVNKVLEHFDTKVDLMNSRALEVVALKPRQLLELKESLKLAAETAAQHLQPVPNICNIFIQEKHNSKTRKERSMTHRVVRLDELQRLLPDTGDDVARINTIKYTLLCLHNMGEAIYFGPAEDFELDNHAIFDVQWFVKDVIGKFIPALPRNDDRCSKKAKIGINPLHEKLRKLLSPDCKDPKSTVNTMVKYLEEMGLIIPDWEGADQVIIQTLLKNKFRRWQEEEGTTYRYWGRRMQPQEKDRLLPSGAFSIIQADIAQLCKGPTWQNQRSLELGDGWISFSKDKVKVLVLVGGDNDQWTDRQWVDIMLMVPEDNIRCVEAERILSSMRYCSLDLQLACPVLKLEELVLNPTDVKALLLHEVPNNCREPILLDHLKHIDGLDFSWDPNNQSSIGELLMLSELKQLLESRRSVVDDFNNIAPVYELEQTTMPEFENPEMRKLAEYLTGILQGHLQQLEVSMQTMLDTLCRMERSLKVSQEQVLQRLSKMLEHIQVPKLPYFTDEKNLLFKYSNLAGTRVWIHYMCESGELKHQMDHDIYEGVPITIAHDWIKKYTSVLIPAITVSFLIAKVGTTVAGIPVKDVLYFAEERLKDSINSCFGQSITIRQPAEHEVVEVLEHVKKAAGEQNLTVLMAKYFGLFFHNGAWVCVKHKL